MKTFIEVQAFGDFDILYTECIMVSDEKRNTKSLMKEFCEIEGIPDSEGLDWSILHDTTENYISFLELKGFYKLETEKIYFCD